MAESGAIKTQSVRVDYSVNHNTEAGMPEMQRKAVLAKEAQIRNNKDESTHIFNDAGQEILKLQGKGNTVKVNKDQVAAIYRTMNNMVVTHNHPLSRGASGIRSIGNSFSRPDLMTSINGNVREMRAVSPRYIFSFKRPTGGWGMTGNQASNLYTTAVKNVKAKGREYLNQRNWDSESLERANGILNHQINKEFVRLAKKYYGVDIIYRHKRG